MQTVAIISGRNEWAERVEKHYLRHWAFSLRGNIVQAFATRTYHAHKTIMGKAEERPGFLNKKTCPLAAIAREWQRYDFVQLASGTHSCEIGNDPGLILGVRDPIEFREIENNPGFPGKP